MFDGMSTLVDSLPFVRDARLRAGDAFIARELVTLEGAVPSAGVGDRPFGLPADFLQGAAASEVRV